MGFCAVPTGSTDEGAWPAYVRRRPWMPRWELAPEAEDLNQDWTALTPRVLHAILPMDDERLVQLEAKLSPSSVALLGPQSIAGAEVELRLGSHRVPGAALPLGLPRPAFEFQLDTMQQAALVIGQPRLAWRKGSEWTEQALSTALQDGLRIQLPEAIQFAATSVD